MYPPKADLSFNNTVREKLQMIRTAIPEDAYRIAEIQVESWRTAYRGILPQEYLNGLDVNRRAQVWREFSVDAQAPLFVALERDQITGFCHLVRSRDADSELAAEIAAIYLDPKHWRKGYGSELCSAALSFAEDHGFEWVTLWVLEENSQARRFYEAMGFISDGATKSEKRPGFLMNEVRYRIEMNRREGKVIGGQNARFP